MILIAVTLNSLIIPASQSCSLAMRLYNGLRIQLCKIRHFNRAISMDPSLYKHLNVVIGYFHKIYFTLDKPAIHYVMSCIILTMLIK